ncbi:hypothetical protein M918_10575 [Clostridium sp. BL8]|nr:hypothetical protein M918_10575 [Clostridium sp. BL8]
MALIFTLYFTTWMLEKLFFMSKLIEDNRVEST